MWELVGRTPGVALGDDVPEVDDLLREVKRLLEPHLTRIVEDFYDQPRLAPSILEVVRRLTPGQLARLKVSQSDHVLLLLSPGLDPRVLHERSRAVGRMHAMAGVEVDAYVDAVALHRNAILGALQASAEGIDLVLAHAVVIDRFMKDLQGRLLGFRDLDEAQNRAMLQIVDTVSDARTVADLARGVVEAFGSLDGMAVCMFVRRTADGQLQQEFCSGPGVEAFVAQGFDRGRATATTDASASSGQGPIGRAWRSGEIQLSEATRTDESTASWRDATELLGWEASAAMPLRDRAGSTHAVLSLQAYSPGYFASAGRAAMLEQVKRVTERALAGLEETPSLATGVSAYRDRSSHLALLDSGAVEMVFQPVIELAGGRLTRMEALARLRGDHRLVSPAEFLPAFGDAELFSLFDIGLRQSLDALVVWQRRGLRTGLSVNLPVAAAEDPRYLSVVTELLASYDVQPDRLTLELLETGNIDREVPQGNPGLIDELSRLGVRLAQDDLGSGYSSLLRLRHFAFDEVKIDRSLVSSTERDSGAALTFIMPLNDIAQSLGLSVVIEGLEDDGLIEAAVQLGVEEGQGFGIARPMAADVVVEWAAGYRTGLDPRRTTTSLGSLAAHVAWEHRLKALGDHEARRSLLDMSTCALTSYVHGTGDGRAAELHASTHQAAFRALGSVEHRAGWVRLATRVTGA